MAKIRKLVSVIALIAVFTLFLFSCSADSDASSQSTESETETADESINALSTLDENSYIVEVIGNKFVILSYSSLGTAKAVEDIISGKIDIFDNTDTSSELSVSKDYKYIGTYDNVLAHTIINYASSVGADIEGSEQRHMRVPNLQALFIIKYIITIIS